MKRRGWAAGVWAVIALAVGCSATGSSDTKGAGGVGGGGASSGAGGSGGLGGLGGLDASFDVALDAAPTGARLTGTVWGPHPDGKPAIFPVPGAAIIASTNPPAPLPDGVYCDECLEVPSGDSVAYSNADGTFALDVPPGKAVYLTVQKGQFRRVRPYTAPSAIGTYPLDADVTTLPHKTDASVGDTIPRIALVYGDYDHVEDVLAKVGIGVDDGAYGLKWGSEAGFFDVFNNAGPDEPAHGEPLSALADPARLAQYNVVLFACSYNANFAFMNDPATQQLLRDYVWKGGKLYVSDYAMPVAEMPWHDFAWFTDPLHGGCNESQFPPNCNHGPPFDTPATVPDPNMSAWLGAMGMLDGLVIKENWDTIGDIAPGVIGKDPKSGTDVSAPPKVWVEGPWKYQDKELQDVSIDPKTWDLSPHPLTISWPYNCGRVLFTTYHTVGTTTGGRHPGLLAQERILFYLLMEITVCQDLPVVK